MRRDLPTASELDALRRAADEYVKDWPPLTAEQRDRLSVLLRPTASGIVRRRAA